ncbi:MAG: EthD domain-containing protein [Gammaproteobacteria bacterium]|nr:EthD domain-containing protein [Gammaproteobacteria bacterium]MCZ6773147.1 EthD domain-containing protein [Pseudomonadota bacterium]
MIKLVYCLRKRADVSPEKFHKYWRESHGPLVTSFVKTMNARRYIQSHTIETDLNDAFQASRGLADPYDGITEVWWNSEEDLRASMATEEGKTAYQALLDDESTFIDFANSRVFMTKENLIFDPDMNHPYDDAPK